MFAVYSIQRGNNMALFLFSFLHNDELNFDSRFNFIILEFLMLIEQCIIKFGNNKEAAI